jgi:hypothetical protein
MKRTLQECIDNYKDLSEKILNYDISLINKRQSVTLYSGFHPAFYRFRENAMDILRTYPNEDEKIFWKICNEDRPVIPHSNVEALNIIGECIKYLESVSENQINHKC